MKAKELMIGDFILGNTWSNKAERISSIDTDSIVANIDSVYFEGQFKPIPLTEDILKANGFERNVLLSEGFYRVPKFDMNDVLFKVAKDVCRVELIADHNDNTYTLFRVCYVHEMQHILRVCGLNGLADNFKLKKD